jgi:hypothetical protein
MKENISKDKPYQELRTFDTILRKFKEDTPDSEFVWHRDRRDRKIQVLEDTDWQYQLEDEIPQQLKDTIFIPKDTYHRLIKGKGNLDLRIIEF